MMVWSKERQQLREAVENLIELNGEVARFLAESTAEVQRRAEAIRDRVEQLEATRQEDGTGNDDHEE